MYKYFSLLRHSWNTGGSTELRKVIAVSIQPYDRLDSWIWELAGIKLFNDIRRLSTCGGPNDPQLVITQQAFHRLDQDGNVTQLKDLEFEGVYADWALGSHYHNIYLDPTFPSGRKELLNVCDDHSSLERLAGVNLHINSVLEIKALSQFFPCRKQLL